MGMSPPSIQQQPLPAPPEEPEEEEHYAFEARELSERAKKAKGQNSTNRTATKKKGGFKVEDGTLLSPLGETVGLAKEKNLLGM